MDLSRTATCARCIRKLRFRTIRNRRSCLPCALRTVLLNPRPHFSATQLDAATELIEDGGIVSIGLHEYRTVSSDGSTIYATSATWCTCKAGAMGRRCYHSAAARMVS